MSIVVEIINEEQREALGDQIANRFGLSHIRLSEYFNGATEGFWLSAENGERASDGRPLFDYWTADWNRYEHGVHSEFVEYVNELGYWPEWNDAGTLMLWPE